MALTGDFVLIILKLLQKTDGEKACLRLLEMEGLLFKKLRWKNTTKKEQDGINSLFWL